MRMSPSCARRAVAVLFCLVIACVPANAQVAAPLDAKTLKQAEDAFAARRWQEALDAFTRIAAAQPANADARMKLGVALFQTGRLAEAEQSLTDGLTRQPKSPFGLYFRGVVRYFRAGSDASRLEGAIQDLQHARQIDPTDVESAYMGAWAHFIAGSDRAALDGMQAYLNAKGYQAPSSQFAVLLAVLAARRNEVEAPARLLLDECAKRCDVTAWPYPIVRLYRGELTAQDVLKAADTVDKQTEARTYIAIDAVNKGAGQKVIPDLQWVNDKGNRQFFEWVIAANELRAQRALATLPPTAPPVAAQPQTFGGVGLELRVADSVLTVQRVVPGTPAARAGVTAGDQILRVDGVSTAGLTVQQASDLIRGAAGTAVKLAVQVNGTSRVLDLTLTRGIVTATPSAPAPATPAPATPAPATPAPAAPTPAKPTPAKPAPATSTAATPAPWSRMPPAKGKSSAPVRSWSALRLGFWLTKSFPALNSAKTNAEKGASADSEIGAVTMPLSIAGQIIRSNWESEALDSMVAYLDGAERGLRDATTRPATLRDVHSKHSSILAVASASLSTVPGDDAWYYSIGRHAGFLLAFAELEQVNADLLKGLAAELQRAPASVPQELLATLRRIASYAGRPQYTAADAKALMWQTSDVGSYGENADDVVWKPVPSLGVVRSARGLIPEVVGLCLDMHTIVAGEDLRSERADLARDARKNCADTIKTLNDARKTTNMERHAYLQYSGILSYGAGKYEDAQRSYEEILRINARDAAAHYNLGLSLARRGKNKDAVRAMQKAAELNTWYAEGAAYKLIVK